MMWVLAVQTGAGAAGRVGQVADTFGVDWPHLISQIISFGIVCAVLYALAYKPILRMLDARRQQIAAGLANAEKIKTELARIDAERRDVLQKADNEGKALIEEARAAGRLLLASFRNINAKSGIDYDQWRTYVGDVHPQSLFAAMIIWARVHGIVSLEIQGNLPPFGEHGDALYRYELHSIATQFIKE